MRLLVALSPFLVFLLLDRVIGVETGLFAAAATSAAMLVAETVFRRRRPKILELGTLALFGGLAVYIAFSGARWSVASVRLAVDTGLLTIVLASMVIGQPFTLQYATDPTAGGSPRPQAFVRANYVATAIWAAAFAVMVAVDCAWVVVPGFSPTVVLVVSLAAVFGAVRFPRWFLQDKESGAARLATRSQGSIPEVREGSRDAST